MTRTPLMMLLLLGSASSASAEDSTVERAHVPLDYASGLSLETQPHLAAQTLLVPLEVYRGARPGLPDIAVFAADGRPVPHALRMLEEKVSEQRDEQRAPLFPLTAELGKPAAELSLHVQRNEGGTVIAVRASDEKADTRVTGYLVDASALGRDVAGVRLVLGASDTNFTVPIKVEASDDLNAWRTLSSGSVVGRLSHEGHTVERTRIELIATTATFLRLSWPDHELPVEVRETYLEYTGRRVDFTRARARTTVGPVVAENNAYEIDLGGVLPLASVIPLLPEDVLLRAALLIRTRSNDERKTVQEGLLYRLRHEGEELRSGPLGLTAQRARFLTLKVEEGEAGLAGRPLSFDVEYAPEQLVFISHSPGPYLLAYGSYKSPAASFSADKLLEFMSPAAREALPRESVRVLDAQVLAGESARVAPPPAPSYRKPLLWAVLIAGAATLLLLAVRMLRRTD